MYNKKCVIIFLFIFVINSVFASQTRVSSMGDSFITIDDQDYYAFNRPAKLGNYKEQNNLFFEFRDFSNNDDFNLSYAFLNAQGIIQVPWNYYPLYPYSNINKFSFGGIFINSGFYFGFKSDVNHVEYVNNDYVWLDSGFRSEDVFLSILFGLKLGDLSCAFLLDRLNYSSEFDIDYHNGEIGFDFNYQLNSQLSFGGMFSFTKLVPLITGIKIQADCKYFLIPELTIGAFLELEDVYWSMNLFDSDREMSFGIGSGYFKENDFTTVIDFIINSKSFESDSWTSLPSTYSEYYYNIRLGIEKYFLDNMSILIGINHFLNGNYNESGHVYYKEQYHKLVKNNLTKLSVGFSYTLFEFVKMEYSLDTFIKSYKYLYNNNINVNYKF